ncbi:AraC family transcriptional regulator [Collimonas arenae]|nr:AraC family transcriptional regulator [Collimonas arenae]
MSKPKSEVSARGVVPSTYVRLLYEHLEKKGIDAAVLLGEEVPEAADRGLLRYPVGRWRVLLERAAEHLNDPLLGLHLGQTITPAHLGVMGYVLLACPHLAAALTRMQHYHRLLYDTNPLHVTAQGFEVKLEWGVERGRPGALVDECAITGLIQFARDVTGLRGSLIEVGFVNQAPPDLKPYRDWFGCPVLFEQATTTVRFPLDRLTSPLRQPDASLLHVLEQQAATMLAELPQTDDFEQAVRRCIARLIREGEPELERVANELHVSSRTLQRRLDESGVNFRALREEIRHRLAEHYLLDPRLQLVEIAQLLGYSEQSAFTRAFQRWSGRTPLTYRHFLP